MESESEAIALTEDAIFLAKRELYREMIRVDDESIRIIAENIVNTTIDNVLREIQQKEEEDELEQLSRNFPYPDHYFEPSDSNDASNCLFSQLTDPFILDSLHAEPQRQRSLFYGIYHPTKRATSLVIPIFFNPKFF